MQKVQVEPKPPLPQTRDITSTGTSDIPDLYTFQSNNRHSDVTPESLSERWGISIAAAKQTLKRTTQRFVLSALLPLSLRYRLDMIFDAKRLSSTWSTDTVDGQCKSLDGCRYAQIFANHGYFAKLYPMASKSQAGCGKGTSFHSTCTHYSIKTH